MCGTHTCRSSFGPPRSNDCDPGPSPDSPKPVLTRADGDLFALLPLRVVGIVNRAVSGACQSQPRLTYWFSFGALDEDVARQLLLYVTLYAL